MSPDGVDGIEVETRRLQQIRDQAKLRAEIAGLALPWWRRGTSVGGIVAVLAAIVPVATAINAKMQSDKELALKNVERQQASNLASQRFREEVRAGYLSRMKDEAERQRTLRFLVAVSPDDKLRKWAEDEKKLVDAEIASLKERISRLEIEKAAAIASLETPSAKLSGKTLALKRRISEISMEKRRLEANISAPTEVTMPTLGGDTGCISRCMKDWGYSADAPLDELYRNIYRQCHSLCDQRDH